MHALVQLPFPVFELAKYSYSVTTAPVIEVKVIPGQVGADKGCSGLQ